MLNSVSARLRFHNYPFTVSDVSWTSIRPEGPAGSYVIKYKWTQWCLKFCEPFRIFYIIA